MPIILLRPPLFENPGSAPVLGDVPKSSYRAFSCVMLSSNMTASIATAINIHLCKHFSMNFSILVQAHDNRIYIHLHVHVGMRNCPGYPGQSAQSDNHVGGQHDVGEKALLRARRGGCVSLT